MTIESLHCVRRNKCFFCHSPSFPPTRTVSLSLNCCNSCSSNSKGPHFHMNPLRYIHYIALYIRRPLEGVKHSCTRERDTQTSNDTCIDREDHPTLVPCQFAVVTHTTEQL